MKHHTRSIINVGSLSTDTKDQELQEENEGEIVLLDNYNIVHQKHSPVSRTSSLIYIWHQTPDKI